MQQSRTLFVTNTGQATLDLAIAVTDQSQLDLLESGLVQSGLKSNERVRILAASNCPCEWSYPEPDPINVLPNECSSFQLWAAAIQSGKSEYVAILDAGSPPDDGWWIYARNAIDDGADIFYGSVKPGWPESDRRLAGYIIEYAQFNNLRTAPSREFPGNNIVFRRSMLAASDFPSHGFHKTFFINRLSAAGSPSPTPIGKMSVRYRKQYDPTSYRHRRFAHGRAYGTNISENRKYLRMWYALRCFGLPFVRMVRIYQAIKHDRSLRRTASHLITDILLSEFAWSIGEGVGCVSGARETPKPIK